MALFDRKKKSEEVKTEQLSDVVKTEELVQEPVLVEENPTQPSSPESHSLESLDISEESTVSKNPSRDVLESPVEEKIHDLVEEKIDNAPINGWHPIHTAPRNGMPVKLVEKPEGDSVLCVWKKTRAFANPTKRWEITGKWVNFISGLDISFIPKYWQERFSSKN